VGEIMSETAQLFDEVTRRKLEQIMLHASRVRAGAIKGERRSSKRGTSIEFADYRNYAPGDDLRRLDWNIYARTDRPLTRLYEDEEDLAVHLLLDTSASMDWTAENSPPASSKFTFARRIFAGLAYTALAENDRLAMATLAAQPARFGPVRGRGHGASMLRYVGGLSAAGKTDLNASLREYALRVGRAGLVILISDLFSDGYLEGVKALLAKGCEVAVIHLLSPDEAEPPLAGDLRLVDVETGVTQEVSLDETMRRLYIARVGQWRDDVRAECAKRGVHYTFARTDSAWEKVILQDLRRLGVVR
jgi:uncharacterized protein (DUF58 family)